MQHKTQSEKKELVASIEESAKTSNVSINAAVQKFGITPQTFYAYKRSLKGIKKTASKPGVMKNSGSWHQSLLDQAYGKVTRQVYDTILTAQL